MAVACGNGSKSGVDKSPIKLRFAVVQNKFQQTNKNKINHINDNHIKFEVSLHFWGSGLLCGIAFLCHEVPPFLVNFVNKSENSAVGKEFYNFQKVWHIQTSCKYRCIW